jgi:hypothetical protein
LLLAFKGRFNDPIGSMRRRASTDEQLHESGIYRCARGGQRRMTARSGARVQFNTLKLGRLSHDHRPRFLY